LLQRFPFKHTPFPNATFRHPSTPTAISHPKPKNFNKNTQISIASLPSKPQIPYPFPYTTPLTINHLKQKHQATQNQTTKPFLLHKQSIPIQTITTQTIQTTTRNPKTKKHKYPKNN
jgi:hypothetical protein